MVEVSKIAKLLEDDLNGRGEVKFKLYANTGEYDAVVRTATDRPVVNGVVIPMPGTVIPIQGLNNYYMTLSLGFIVKPEMLAEVQDTLTRYIQESAGAGLEIDGFVAVVNFDMPMIGDMEIRPMIGKSVPIQTNVYYQLIRNGMLSNNCKVSVDGEELLALDFAIVRARISQTDNIQNQREMQTVIGQQGLTIDMTTPYLKKPKVQELVQDIALGQLNKTYTLKYADGVVKSVGRDPEWSVVLCDGSVSYQAGKVPTLRLKFQLARGDVMW